jgi:hypothetical protein
MAYITTDFGLACALLVEGMDMEDMSPIRSREGYKKIEFTFMEDEKAKKMASDYYNNILRVSPFRYSMQMKELKVRMKGILDYV